MTYASRRTQNRKISVICGVFGFVAAIVSPSKTPATTLTLTAGSAIEPVYQWEKSRCADNDIPDAPLRAVRLQDGSVVAFAAHFINHRLVGKDLNSIRPDCNVVFQGDNSPDPAAFSDRVWISSTWSNDGVKIFALGHDEYQAQTHVGMCKFDDYMRCWYNTIIPLTSDDGGAHFVKMGLRSVASIPVRQDVDQGKNRGFFEPSNIIKYNGFFFSIIHTGNEGQQAAGNCLFRSRALEKPDTWEWFDGRAYQANFDPYHDQPRSVKPCAALNELKGMVSSVVYFNKSKLFVAVSSFKEDDDPIGAFYYAVSNDLIHWRNSRKLLALPVFWSRLCGQYSYAYPSLVDISSPSRNFDEVDHDSYLYLTRQHLHNCGETMDRDLVRVKIHLTVK